MPLTEEQKDTLRLAKYIRDRGEGFHGINIINPQKIGTIVSYSDYISPKEKLSILIFVTIRYIRGKLCL